MLKLTKRTEYGLIALTHLAGRQGEVVPSREIAEAFPVPKRLLAEVMKDLSHAGLVESTRGVRGGYSLALAPDDISLGQIVSALEGAPQVSGCGELGQHGTDCEVQPVCPIRSPLHAVQSRIWSVLESTSLGSIVGGRMGSKGLTPNPLHTSAETRSRNAS